MKQVAKSASDIFSRVPCSAPKGGVPAMGSLPHVASKLAAGLPVVIVAFGSSSTQGWGSSSPDFAYPNRLFAQLKRQYPSADITVLNRGKGGDDAPEMMKRLQAAVLDANPDLVIWQLGTNAVLRGFDPAVTEQQVEEGIARIQAAGSDVVLVDPQYSPRVTERPENAGRMVNLLHRVARLRHVGIFPRFEVMRDWHEHSNCRSRPSSSPTGCNERLGLRLLRATARRRHHPLGRPDQARRRRAVRGAEVQADVTAFFVIASEAKQSIDQFAALWIASSLRSSQ